ncbi:MAG: succinate dehydrogenase assembly factor 2 [Magnetococcales bacterium]|nr:succinate dehydrogenase assembly factor 2 [Magnetococcales bacterium]
MFSPESLPALRRRLVFLTSRRSMLEMEELLRRHLNLEQMDLTECLALEKLLQCTDNDLLDWISGVRSPPPEVDRGLLSRLSRQRENID